MQTFCLALFPLHWHEPPIHCRIQNNTYSITAAVKYVSVLYAYSVLQTGVRNDHGSTDSRTSDMPLIPTDMLTSMTVA